jgi:hypothetical protein
LANVKNPRSARNPARRKAVPEELTEEQVYRLSRTAYQQTLVDLGASVRDAARWMDVSASTVQKLLEKGERIQALRSRRMTRAFLRNLVLLTEIRNHGRWV